LRLLCRECRLNTRASRESSLKLKNLGQSPLDGPTTEEVKNDRNS
jgi:hypothetical protein